MLSRHRRFLLAVGLLSYLCEDTIATIRTKIIKEGSDFLFECFGDADVFFTYPINQTESDEVISYTSPIEVSKNRDENGTYCYRLYRPSTVFGDTGWYGCSYDPVTITRRDFFDSRILSTYLYVESETVRFVERPNRQFSVANVDEDFVIPCRPTSPTAEVKLKKIGANVNHLPVTQYPFDPKFGFTLHKIDEHHRGSYQCTIAPKEAVSYNLYVSYENTLPNPVISNRSDVLRLTKGESLFLKCSVSISSDDNYGIFWIPTHQNYRVTPLFDRTTDINGLKKKLAFLEVRNVSYNDEGIYECKVTKGIGEKYSRTYVQVHDDLAFIKPDMSPKSSRIDLTEGEPLRLVCSGKSDIFFAYPGLAENITGPTPLPTSPIETNETRDENDTYCYDFRRPKTIAGDTGWYGCSYNSLLVHRYDYYHTDPRNSWIYVHVESLRAPIINNTNLEKGEIIIDVTTQASETVTLYCFALGIPKPSITWFKDGTKLMVGDKKYKFSNNSQELELKYPLDVDSSGVYTCRAENRIRKVEVSQRVTIKGLGTNKSVGLIVLLVALAMIVVIRMIYLAFKIRRKRIMRRELMEAGLTYFEKGAVESLNPELTVDDQADLLPYNKKWEFPRDRLKLGKQLGSGAFGVVLKAEAMGICEREAVTTVAVKMVRRGPNLFSISTLASELKIMIHLGKHLNIVNLLGACTKNILKRELLVIVEFCRFGNLHDYLLRNRNGFMNQIDPETGKLDLNIDLDALARTAKPSSISSRAKSVESSASVSKNRNSHSDSVQCHKTATDTDDLKMSADDPVLTYTRSGSSKCQGDYQDSNLKPICTQDLLSWAFQVARGMEYLSQRRILHGDLATRNILLADDNVVKICDFGLAKSMYKEEIYKKKSDCPLPIKWLSIETMRDRIFSTQSDVWSFGIVLWELFTLSETPYPGVQAEMVYQKLIEGYRMEQPDYATSEVYDVMRQCWNAEPSLRPSFTELVDSVGNLLEDNVRSHYIELNTPYLDMNKTLLEAGMNDYLTMVSVPDHVVLSPPAQDHAKDAVESSHMLNREVEDPYLKPISSHERRTEFVRSRGDLDRSYVNLNSPENLELIDMN